jgi:hypothetical protein
MHELAINVVDATGFQNLFDSIKGIQVGTSITADDLDSEAIVVSCPQDLYFWGLMEHLLIPPSQ